MGRDAQPASKPACAPVGFTPRQLCRQDVPSPACLGSFSCHPPISFHSRCSSLWLWMQIQLFMWCKHSISLGAKDCM